MTVNELEFSSSVKNTTNGQLFIGAKMINNLIIDSPDFEATTVKDSMRIEHLKCYKSVYEKVFGEGWSTIHVVEFFDSEDTIVTEYVERDYK